jgi:hypothetical protein
MLQFRGLGWQRLTGVLTAGLLKKWSTVVAARGGESCEGESCEFGFFCRAAVVFDRRLNTCCAAQLCGSWLKHCIFASAQCHSLARNLSNSVENHGSQIWQQNQIHSAMPIPVSVAACSLKVVEAHSRCLTA